MLHKIFIFIITFRKSSLFYALYKHPFRYKSILVSFSLRGFKKFHRDKRGGKLVLWYICEL